jgi:oligoendopeptidase F
MVREAFTGRWIDVFENAGKRSGAYSAPVYGSHPYMLLNYNETLDAVFTLAHEMGHSMHTVLAHRTQPFRYAAYEIFVAEVPSTLNEALFLDFMLGRAASREERIVLLQHAIDSIAGTFFTQVLFADFELQAHRLVEQDQPVTADVLNGIYAGLLREYYGPAIDEEHPALLQHAVLRLPVFDLLRIDRAAHAGSAIAGQAPARGCRGAVSVTPRGRRQRLSDRAAAAGGGGPHEARHREGGLT